MPNSEPQRSADKSARYALAAIIIGCAVFGVSFLPLFARGREQWTKEQALELQQASMQIQELTHKLAAQTPDNASKSAADDYQQAVHHFENLQSQLKDARSRSGSLKAVFRVVGLLLVAIGATNFALTKRKKTADLQPVHAVRTP